jgi:hypothetical protein
MQLTAELAIDRRQRVESRLRTNIMAWLTTRAPVPATRIGRYASYSFTVGALTFNPPR